MEKIIRLAPGVDDAEIRKRGEEARTLFAVAFWVAVAGLIGDVVIGSMAHLARNAYEGGFRGVATDVGLRLVDALPLFILVEGLWRAQRLFGRVSAGAVFTTQNAEDMSRIGSAMQWSGLAAVVIAPTLRAWIEGSSTFDVNLEGWALIVGVVGVAIALIGRIWAVAVTIKSDADLIV